MLNAGIDTCFTNPGTSEMHFVAALDDAPGMRAVLALFEGVATGAADGYARIADKPAATLLHLGCGLGNGMANLHNARKARVPVLNIVGDHATYHMKYDAALQSDIETLAKSVSSWVRTSQNTTDLCKDAVDAIESASKAPGSVSTLILPADVSWGEGGRELTPDINRVLDAASGDFVSEIGRILKQDTKSAILLGGKALRADALVVADAIARSTGTRLFSEAFPARIECGAGLPTGEMLDDALSQLKGVQNLIVVDALLPQDSKASQTKCYELSGPTQSALASLNKLAAELGVNVEIIKAKRDRVEVPTGELNAECVCQAIAATLPENAIISDESGIAPDVLTSFLSRAPSHDRLCLTGDAAGQALPVSIGASIAGKDRTVIVLVNASSAMQTIQSLWTIARERLNIKVVVLNPVSAGVGIGGSSTDFVRLSKGMGVPALSVTSTEALTNALQRFDLKNEAELVEVRY
jgi:acetolactate synthase-1/2/3 large subunit